MGGLDATTREATKAIGMMGAAIRAQKSCFRAAGFRTMRPILGSEPAEVHHLLGLPLDADGSARSLMCQVELRGKHNMHQIQAAFDEHGLPLETHLAAIQNRVVPKALWGAEFVIVRRDWENRLDNLQAGWLRRLLDTEVAVPRFALLWELGMPWRLRATVLCQVFRLLASVDLLPRAHLAAKVATVAAQWPATWVDTAAGLAEDLGLPRIASWANAGATDHPSQDAAARKLLLRRYMRGIVRPTISAVERRAAEDWWAQHPAAAENCSARAVDAAAAGWPVPAIRLWVQLRWRGKLTNRAASEQEVNACVVCGTACGNTVEHLLDECQEFSDVLRELHPPIQSGPGLLVKLRRPMSEEDVATAIRAASSLRRARKQSG